MNTPEGQRMSDNLETSYGDQIERVWTRAEDGQ